MGATGAIIMAFFRSVFAAMTLGWPLAMRGPVLAVPFVVAAAIIAAAIALIRRPGPDLPLDPRVGRVIMWSSLAEGVGIFLAINIVINLGRPDWQLPAIALVVGLHFVQIAAVTRHRTLGLLATVLILAGIAGTIAPPPTGPLLSGITATIALWAAALLALRRETAFKRPTG